MPLDGVNPDKLEISREPSEFFTPEDLSLLLIVQQQISPVSDHFLHKLIYVVLYYY